MNDRSPPSDGFGIPVSSVDVNGIVRDLLDVAKVAMGEDMPVATESEVRALLLAVLAVIERVMPPALQAQDRRVVEARELLRLLDLSRGG